MRSIYDFFVRLPEMFEDEIKVGDTSIYIDPKWSEFDNRKMEAVVVALPEKYDTPVKIGDTLYFHHHVVISNNGKGQIVYDDVYSVAYDPEKSLSCQAYAFKCAETGNIELISDWVFLTPEEQSYEQVTTDGIIIDLKKPECNEFGYVKYGSKKTEELGLTVGDKVMIMKNADYKMKIDGEELFRVHIDHIFATGF